MPDLHFFVALAEAVGRGAARLGLRVGNVPAAERIAGVRLFCQVRIEPARRGYTPGERARLRDLFGEPARFGETLRPFPWVEAAIEVPPFEESTLVAIDLPLAPAAARYLGALEAGHVPLSLLFRGLIFYEASDGRPQVAPIPWAKETAFRLPVQMLREASAT
jgi:hypothetical protein